MKKIILFLLIFTAIGIAQTHTFWGTNNGVKVYRALITQAGDTTAPTVTVTVELNAASDEKENWRQVK